MVHGHAKGVPITTQGSMNPDGGGKAEIVGHAKGVNVDWTPGNMVPEKQGSATVIGHAKGVSVDWTPSKGYTGQSTPMSDRAVKASE
jgi:hypothetical protein